MRLLRPTVLVPALALLAAGLPSPTAAVTCPPANSHVWFLGVIYDPEQREDFILDVDNFEFYLSELRQVYCIPDAQAKIFAFENNFTRNGKTYQEGSEANVVNTIASMASSANAHPDSIFFFFLSSHGLFYASKFNCPGGSGTRAPGSFSGLKSGGGQDGNFYDCELGHALNSNFAPHVRMFVAVDCSFCGGFSDSLTAVSGTVPDNSLPRSSGVPKPSRVVFTGCAITTECFGSSGGGVSYKYLRQALLLGGTLCDGYTAPGFPAVQGINAPVKLAPLNPPDGRCTASEWVFAAIARSYATIDPIAWQEQFRMKYGFPDLASDIQIR